MTLKSHPRVQPFLSITIRTLTCSQRLRSLVLLIHGVAGNFGKPLILILTKNGHEDGKQTGRTLRVSSIGSLESTVARAVQIGETLLAPRSSKRYRIQGQPLYSSSFVNAYLAGTPSNPRNLYIFTLCRGTSTFNSGIWGEISPIFLPSKRSSPARIPSL